MVVVPKFGLTQYVQMLHLARVDWAKFCVHTIRIKPQLVRTGYELTHRMYVQPVQQADQSKPCLFVQNLD